MAKGRKCVGNFARQELWMRGFLRHSFTETVQSLSDDPDASMAYSIRAFHKKVYVKYGLGIDGWPNDIPFTNLSDVTGFARISALFVLWQTGLMKFVRIELNEQERAAMRPADVAPGSQKLNKGVPPNLGRSDIKKHRKRAKVDAVKYPPRFIRDGTTSDKWVTAEAEAQAEAGAGRQSSGKALSRAGGSGGAMDRMGREDPDDPIEDWEDDEVLVSAGMWDLRQSWSRRVEAVMYRNSLAME